MKKRKLKSYSFAIVAVIVVVVLALLPTLIKAGKNKAITKVSIQSTEAAKADITTSLSGSGTLTNDNDVSVSVPSGVEITKYLVSDGQNVTTGTALATVDPVSVTSAISEVKESLEKIEEQIEDLDESETTETVKATVSGRVKKIYVEEGQDVKSAMVSDGSVVVLSLDGKMAVDIETKSVKEGDTVVVKVSDTEYEGYVDKVSKGVATITITDDGTEYGAEAVVSGGNGISVGKGTLYVHSAWSVGSYSGTVSDLYVSENQKISAGDKIFSLKDVDSTAKYNMLTAEHRVYEDLLADLFKLNEDGTIYAECDGMITSIDETLLAAADTTETVTATQTTYVSNAAEMTEQLLGTKEIGVISTANAPSGDDSITYKNQAGVVTAVNGSELSLNVNESPLTIDDYSNLGSDVLDTGLMTSAKTYSFGSVSAYQMSNGSWTSVSASDISVGDILIFAYDENDPSTPLWIILSKTESTGDNTGDDSGETGQPDQGNTGDDSGETGQPDQGNTGDDSGETGQPDQGNTGDNGSQTVQPDQNQQGQPDGQTVQPDQNQQGQSDGQTGIPDQNQSGVPSSGNLSDMINQGNISSNDSFAGYNASDLANMQNSMLGSGTFGSGSLPSTDLSALYGDSFGAATQVANALYSTVKTTVMEVVPLDKVSVDISVDELDILSVSLNQEAVVTLDALTGQSFTGVVTEIDTNGTNNGGNAKYTVTLSIDRTENMIEGMNASAVIEMARNKDLLTVPAAAVYNEGGHDYVYTSVEGDELGGKVEVETGLSDGENVEIKSGLSENDTVYYETYGG